MSIDRLTKLEIERATIDTMAYPDRTSELDWLIRLARRDLEQTNA